MPDLYIISGPNGAGKTTASFTVLPEILDCDEFVNADEIARGLSPLNPDKAAIEAGRLMLRRIDHLIRKKIDFAFETTLASRSFIRTIENARASGYQITLIYFWLESVELAIERVRIRVEEGGHDIPTEVIKRRFHAGLKNLFNLYMQHCDFWMLVNNSDTEQKMVADGGKNKDTQILDFVTFELIINQIP